MNKLKLYIDELVVESFTTADSQPMRGTVEGHVSCNTCEDIDCTRNCTGFSCDTTTDPGTAVNPCTGGTICGPGGSNPNQSCFSDAADCYTYYVWTGCDYSCEIRPCR